MVEPKADKKTTSKVEKWKTTSEKRKRTRVENKKPKTAQKKAATGKLDTQQAEERSTLETTETKLDTTDTRKTIDGKEEAQQEEVSPETLAREVAVVLVALSTPAKPKGKTKRQPSMYFKAQKSTRIKIEKLQPPSKESIIIEDVPTVTKEGSPSKISITYERGSPKTST